MPVEIIPPPESMRLSAPIDYKHRLKPTPPGFVPEGFDGNFNAAGVNYEVHDFRDRPGHEPGAKVIVGGEVKVRLGPEIESLEINHIIFRWFHV